LFFNHNFFDFIKSILLKNRNFVSTNYKYAIMKVVDIKNDIVFRLFYQPMYLCTKSWCEMAARLDNVFVDW